MKQEKFYKLARSNGWDWYTGKTINYRKNISKLVKCPDFDKDGKLCSEAFIYASREPNQCFVGAKIPCSVYRVEGVPIKEDENKCGFKKLRVLKELNPEALFKWNYKEACNPINPFDIEPPKKILKSHIDLLEKWASVWDLIRASVWNSVWVSVWASVWASVWDLIRASVGASIGASGWASVKTSIWASIWAYIGSFFPLKREEWLNTERIKTKGYPFQPAVDLWRMGLVASFDGKTWRLHGGKKGGILWQGKLSQ